MKNESEEIFSDIFYRDDPVPYRVRGHGLMKIDSKRF